MIEIESVECYKKLPPECAQAILNDVTYIVNLLYKDEKNAFYHLGILTESLAQQARKNENK